MDQVYDAVEDTCRPWDNSKGGNISGESWKDLDRILYVPVPLKSLNLSRAFLKILDPRTDSSGTEPFS